MTPPDPLDEQHRLSMDDGPDEHTPPFCECGAWWPCPDAPRAQPLEQWERELAASIFGKD